MVDASPHHCARAGGLVGQDEGGNPGQAVLGEEDEDICQVCLMGSDIGTLSNLRTHNYTMPSYCRLKSDPRVIALFRDAHNGKVPGRHHSQLQAATKHVESPPASNKASTRVSPVINIAHAVPDNQDRRKSVNNADGSGKTADTPERSPRRESQGKGRRKSLGNADESGKTPRDDTPERSPRRESQGKGRRKSLGNADESGKTPRNDTPERSPRRGSTTRPSGQSGLVR
jgi:hypothetical protein